VIRDWWRAEHGSPQGKKKCITKKNGINSQPEHFLWNTKTYICHYAIVPDIM
jgi:hypothetical protein